MHHFIFLLEISSNLHSSSKYTNCLEDIYRPFHSETNSLHLIMHPNLNPHHFYLLKKYTLITCIEKVSNAFGKLEICVF